jgi:signal transduction histidine kinase
MKSLHARILIWSLTTLAVSLVALFLLARYGTLRNVSRGNVFSNLHSFQRELAVQAYEGGGPSALKPALAQNERYFQAEHYLLDGKGRDLLTGDDRSDLLRIPNSLFGLPPRVGDRVLIRNAAPDSRYTLVVLLPPPIDPMVVPLSFLVVCAAVAFLSYKLSVSLVVPLQELSGTLHRFGKGELSARVRSRRRDEIGQLARTYDEMADRLESLVVSERRLLLDVSHELRSPLVRLRFAAELIRTAEDKSAAIGRMTREIERLSQLIQTLLEVTRSESEPDRQEKQVIYLDTLVMQVVEDVRLEASAKGIEILVNAAADITVEGDGELLRRAFENVLRNAVAYSPQERPIPVVLVSEEGRAILTVRDFGPGVPDQFVEKIFAPFFRVDQSRTASTGGTGLGLSIASRAIQVHGGSIHARNADPGLLVTMELPVLVLHDA